MKRPATNVTGIILVFCTAAAAQQTTSLRTTREQVGRYESMEFLIDTDRRYDNPFDPCEVRLDILITSPVATTVTLPAFYGQNYERRDLQQGGKTVAWFYPQDSGSWQARFTPRHTGTYTARARLTDASGESVCAPVSFECRDSSHKGFLRTSRRDPRFLELTTGQPFFAIGQNLAFIGEGQYVTVPVAEEIFGKLAANGANFVRIWTGCCDWALALEAPKSAWTRSWNRKSPIVPIPGSEGEPQKRRCVKIEGQDGASLTVSPSHPVALRPGTSYVIAGRAKLEGPEAIRLQVGSRRWNVTSGESEWRTFEQNFTTGPAEHWLGRTTIALLGAGTAWLDEISLTQAGGGPDLLWEADVNRPARGRYNQLDSFMLDQIVRAAEREGIYLMLCVLMRDLYMNDLSKVGSSEYRQATEDTKKFMRYAVARWGYSTSVAAWEYFNEMDPGKPTDKYYAEVGEYLTAIDIYGHLRTTSTWHPSARDCRHPQIDVAQEHHYMRPEEDDFTDEVDSILRQSHWLREQAPNKPALIGEFGLATQKWGLSEYMKQDREGIHFHNCLWASAFSGVSGTAMFWWWEPLDLRNAYRHYKPLSTFLADLPPTGLQPAAAAASDPRVRILGYQGKHQAALWLVNRQATWYNLVVDKRRIEPVDSATVTIAGLSAGRYTVLWWDTTEGMPISRKTLWPDEDILEIAIPPFTRDLACKITPTAVAQ